MRGSEYRWTADEQVESFLFMKTHITHSHQGTLKSVHDSAPSLLKPWLWIRKDLPPQQQKKQTVQPRCVEENPADVITVFKYISL